MNYLLDTNIITFIANRHAVVLSQLNMLTSDDELYTCFIVVGEREYGIHNAAGTRQQRLIRAAGTPVFSALTDIWESNDVICRQYGIIHAQLRAAGQLIPSNDIWIAAAAMVNNAVVVTADLHFQRVAGLKVVDWTQP